MNPIIQHKFTCDPTAIVVNDKVFLYTGHDETPIGVDNYIMNEWLVFSSSDLVEWTEHPVPLRATDFAWASGDAYASKVIEKDGKYYWFVSVSHAHKKGKAIGVAVSSSPVGPFHDAIGKALITHDMLPVSKSDKANLDPSILIDNDGITYLFWGNGMCYFCKLKNDLSGIDGDISIVDLPKFEEGSHIHKYNNQYYLSYGYEMPEKVAYVVSDNIKGPWRFMGIINDIPYNCVTNRPCIIEFNDQHYFIYHNGALPNGGSHRRSVCIDELHYKADGTIQKVVMSLRSVRVGSKVT
jgi:hypothetical protein